MVHFNENMINCQYLVKLSYESDFAAIYGCNQSSTNSISNMWPYFNEIHILIDSIYAITSDRL